ncbi:putative nicotinate-nucleotide adenylyltransferase [Companilactobacillus sp. RD055328]|uniref:nicotinate-nucleotide adenylyltransferase n=1 Tax=Companilactobacillus sp. RD055328 TaxID=2916634 RepID=UPI001FC8E2DB|nr:nicotinate-nucleotide adenylyltransferase [Companilactobacillus sp. RD055328]GKQ42513.1 putative nicotinate-nucleotide adenylyltransferase [Companilactobacillus sp. RD055328]
MSSVITSQKTQSQTINNNHKKSIGILGGTFNPPHIAHLVMAQQVLDQLSLDEIWFIPDNIPPHVDRKDAIDAIHRVEMVRLAIEDNPQFKLDLTEINRGGVSYTFDTMKLLKKANPDVDFYFIMGGDMVEYLPTWNHIDELTKLVQFVGVCRPGFEQDSKYPVIWVNSPLLNISSTDIRNKLNANHTIKYLVPNKVEEYIKQEGLYHD